MDLGFSLVLQNEEFTEMPNFINKLFLISFKGRVASPSKNLVGDFDLWLFNCRAPIKETQEKFICQFISVLLTIINNSY